MIEKLILLCTFLLFTGYGCSNIQQGVENLGQDNNANLANTFRDARLLFQIDYPKNWVITDYIDYSKDKNCKEPMSELCEQGTGLRIANFPTPYLGWSLDYPPPGDYAGIAMKVRPNGGGYIDRHEGENNIIQRDKKEITISGDSKLFIIVYDYKDKSKSNGEGLPTAIAYYYGNNYTYEFDIPRWGPNSEKEIATFKEIVSSFKEIR